MMSRPPITREPGDIENNAPLHLCINAMSILKICQNANRHNDDDKDIPKTLIRTGKAAKSLGCTWLKLVAICKKLGIPLTKCNRRRFIPVSALERIQEVLQKEL